MEANHQEESHKDSERMEQFILNLKANLRHFKQRPERRDEFVMRVFESIKDFEVVKRQLQVKTCVEQCSQVDDSLCIQPQENGNFYYFNRLLLGPDSLSPRGSVHEASSDFDSASAPSQEELQPRPEEAKQQAETGKDPKPRKKQRKKASKPKQNYLRLLEKFIFQHRSLGSQVFKFINPTTQFLTVSGDKVVLLNASQQDQGKLHITNLDWASARQELLHTVSVHNLRLLTLNQATVVFFSKPKELTLLDLATPDPSSQTVRLSDDLMAAVA